MEVRGTQRIVVTLIAQPTRAQLPRDIRATSSDGSAAKIAASPEIRDLRSSRDAQPEQPVRPSVTGASPVINDGHCQVVSRWLRDLRRRRVRSGPLPNIQSGRISQPVPYRRVATAQLASNDATDAITRSGRTASGDRRIGTRPLHVCATCDCRYGRRVRPASSRSCPRGTAGFTLRASEFRAERSSHLPDTKRGAHGDREVRRRHRHRLRPHR
jgi:hypothetical protein